MDPASNLNGNYSISNPIARIATTTRGRGPTTDGRPERQDGDFIPQCDLTNNAANGECAATTRDDVRNRDANHRRRSTRRCSTAGASGRATGSSARRCSSSCCRACRSRSATSSGGCRTSPPPTTCSVVAGRLHAVQHHGAVRSAAARRRRLHGRHGSTTSSPASSARPATTSPTPATSARSTQSYNGMLFNVSARVKQRPDAARAASTPASTVTDYCGICARSCRRRRSDRRRHSARPIRRPAVIDPGFITKVSARRLRTPSRRSTCSSPGPSEATRARRCGRTGTRRSRSSSAALGRPVVVAAQRRSAINLVAPGQVWGDRVNEIDLRFAKILRFGRMRTNVGFDIFNVINSSAVLTYNQTFTPGDGPWLAPQSGADAAVLQGQRADRLLEVRK